MKKNQSLHHAMPQAQQGMVLIVGLIMLLLFTLMVSGAFVLSNTNLKSVGNMQVRSEALSAANFAINQVRGTPFTAAPAASQIIFDTNVDSNLDNDYTVNIAAPVCEQATVAEAAALSSATLPVMASGTYSTVWRLTATVQDPVSGASVRVRSGVRVLLGQTQCDAVCPPAAGVPCA